MLAIAFRFPAGRYHATPWGRHVNEAAVEWPPSPWRIVRALIGVWHRKADRSRYPLPILEGLAGRLAGSPPAYYVPQVVHSHVRHYMPMREGNKDKKTLVFDSFVRIPMDEDLIVGWHDLELPPEEEQLLEELLACLSYLGRAESWVEARRLHQWHGHVNCLPHEFGEIPETEGAYETVSLLCPLAPSAYAKLVAEQIHSGHRVKVKGRNKAKETKETPPESWLAGVCVETNELQAGGWSHPPAAERIWYNLPADAILPAARLPVSTLRNRESLVTTVRFALYGRPLPLVEDAVKIGELARMALMHVVEEQGGRVPALLSGHDLPVDNRHQHAFFLAEPDPQGRIDHLLIHAPGGLDEDTLRAVKRLNRLYTRTGTEWEVWFEGAGDVQDFFGKSICMADAKVWRPITPYLHPWHRKKQFGVAEQVRKECRLRGLIEPESVRVLPEVKAGSRPVRPVHFHRFRGKRGLVQPDTHGCFLELVFPQNIRGPLALGFGCHYGLGLFAAVKGLPTKPDE